MKKEVMSYAPIELGRRKIIIQKSGTTSVEAAENDFKTDRLLILKGGDHHEKDKD
jgi:hypothetical protein